MESKLTRRGFMALTALGAVVPKIKVPLMLDEIDPQRTMMYECSVGTGWVMEFWPKRSVAVSTWNPTQIMTDEKISDRFTKCKNAEIYG